MNAGALIYIGGGRVATTSNLPTARAPNAVPFDAGRLCIEIGGAVTSHVSGLPHGKNGHLVTAMNNTMQIAGYVAGIAITVNGRIGTDDASPIHHYVRGLPVTVDGRVAISAPTKEKH